MNKEQIKEKMRVRLIPQCLDCGVKVGKSLEFKINDTSSIRKAENKIYYCNECKKSNKAKKTHSDQIIELELRALGLIK